MMMTNLSRSIPARELMQAMTLLPLQLRNKYEISIRLIYPALMEKEITPDEFMSHLNHCISFIDYGLLSHLTRKFGSDGLKKEMKSYENGIQIFKKQTTIRDLINHWPGKLLASLKLHVLSDKISQDPSACTLDQLDTL